MCALSAIGCHVLYVAPGPNPLSGRRVFAVQQVSYDGLVVGNKPQEQYEAQKSDASAGSFEADKAESAALFTQQLAHRLTNAGLQLAGGPGPGVVIVVPHVVHYEPGIYTYVYNRATTVLLQVSFLDESGQPIAQDQFRVGVPANLGNPSSGGRFRQAMLELANHVGGYLVRRVNSPP